jgi:hypothetical protein
MPWVNSKNTKRVLSSFSSPERFSEAWKGSAKRNDSSKTASEEREKVSHWKTVKIAFDERCRY